MTYEYAVTVIHIVDGDTLDVTIDLGFRIHFEQRIRLYAVDTPERGQPGYAEATAMLHELTIGSPFPQQITARTVKPADKYGRWLASLSTPTCPDVAQAIIDAGLGVAYFGGAKSPTIIVT